MNPRTQITDSIFVVWNPKAGTADETRELRAEFERNPAIMLHETGSTADAIHTARAAAEAGVSLVVAAGGDGTVNAVVNGLSDHFDTTRLAVLPLGTGNDFCRTLAIPEAPGEAAALFTAAPLDTLEFRKLDVVHVETPASRSYYINMAAGGNSGRMMESMSGDVKRLWGSLSYARSIADHLNDMVTYETTLRIDEAPPEQYSLFNVVLGNGRTSAGGFEVAPRANPEDGLLEVVLILDSSLVDLAALTALLLTGDYLQSEQIVYRRVHRISIEARPDLPFSADGDLLPPGPVTFTVIPRALRVLVGPDYTADPPEQSSLQ